MWRFNSTDIKVLPEMWSKNITSKIVEDMNTKQIYNLLAIILCYGLIIGGFIFFGKSLETKIILLDIIVSCLIFTQFVQFTLFPLFNHGEPVHKVVGVMGIHFAVLISYCTLSLGLMVCGIICEIPFLFQIMGQLAILFIFLIGRVIILLSGEKVQQIYTKEQKIQEEKVSLRLVMDDFSNYIETIRQLDPVIVTKLDMIHESIRFITPSANTEAKMFDSQFVQSINDLKVLMRNTTLNKDKILEEVEHLERIIARRKKTLSTHL